MAKAKNDDQDKKAAKADDKGDGNAKENKDGPKAKDDAKDDAKADAGAKAAPAPEAAPEPAPAPAPAPAAARGNNGEPASNERWPMLPPRAIDTSVAPTTPAPAPGRAPRGDARSFRKADEFCMIYRFKAHLIRRQGKVGQTGEWTVTEYPNMGAAAHAYAQECSELTEEGFVDFR